MIGPRLECITKRERNYYTAAGTAEKRKERREGEKKVLKVKYEERFYFIYTTVPIKIEHIY